MHRTRHSLGRTRRKELIPKRIISQKARLTRIHRRTRIKVPKKAEVVWDYKNFLENYDHFHWLFMPLKPLKKDTLDTENFFTTNFVSGLIFLLRTISKEGGFIIF